MVALLAVDPNWRGIIDGDIERLENGRAVGNWHEAGVEEVGSACRCVQERLARREEARARGLEDDCKPLLQLTAE